MLKNKEVFHLENEIEWLESKTKYNRLARIDIHNGQPAILAYIYMHEDCNQYEIAKYLGLSRASIGISVKRMCKSGFIDVTPSKKDARSTCLKITKKGVKTLVKSDMVLDDYISKKFEGFNDDEIRLHLDMLVKIKRNLTKLYKEDTSKKKQQ